MTILKYNITRSLTLLTIIGLSPMAVFAQSDTSTPPDNMCYFYEKANYQGQRGDVVGGDMVSYMKDSLTLAKIGWPDISFREFHVPVDNAGSLLASVKVGKNCTATFWGALAAISDYSPEVYRYQYNKDNKDISSFPDKDNQQYNQSVGGKKSTDPQNLNAISCSCS